MLFNEMTYIHTCLSAHCLFAMVTFYASPKPYIISPFGWVKKHIQHPTSALKYTVMTFPLSTFFTISHQIWPFAFFSFTPILFLPTMCSIQTKNICKTEQEKITCIHIFILIHKYIFMRPSHSPNGMGRMLMCQKP